MYEIKILNSNDFDAVAKSDPRYAHVDDTNMGFADREKKVAYVRQTHIHDLNKYLVTHELEELEKDESTHEDAYGIRHKKFFKEFLLPMIDPIGLIPVEGRTPGLLSGLFGGGGGGGMLGGLFGGGSESSGSYQPNQTSSGSYSPLASFGNTYGQYSSGNLPQSFSGSYSPTITSGGINTTTQSGNETLDANLLEKLRGNYAGQMTF